MCIRDRDKEHFSIRNIMREPYFTYEHKNTANLFLDVYKRQAFQIALYQLYYTFIFYIISEKIDENFVIKSIEVL